MKYIITLIAFALILSCGAGASMSKQELLSSLAYTGKEIEDKYANDGAVI